MNNNDWNLKVDSASETRRDVERTFCVFLNYLETGRCKDIDLAALEAFMGSMQQDFNAYIDFRDGRPKFPEMNLYSLRASNSIIPRNPNFLLGTPGDVPMVDSFVYALETKEWYLQTRIANREVLISIADIIKAGPSSDFGDIELHFPDMFERLTFKRFERIDNTNKAHPVVEISEAKAVLIGCLFEWQAVFIANKHGLPSNSVMHHINEFRNLLKHAVENDHKYPLIKTKLGDTVSSLFPVGFNMRNPDGNYVNGRLDFAQLTYRYELSRTQLRIIKNPNLTLKTELKLSEIEGDLLNQCFALKNVPVIESKPFGFDEYIAGLVKASELNEEARAVNHAKDTIAGHRSFKSEPVVASPENIYDPESVHCVTNPEKYFVPEIGYRFKESPDGPEYIVVGHTQNLGIVKELVTKE